MSQRSKHVVVGVDGSEPSLRALDWATDEAVRRGARLQVLHIVLESWRLPALPGSTAVALGEALQRQGNELVNAALTRAGERAGKITGATAAAPQMTGRVHIGQTAPTLIEEARHADVLVVGSRGFGGFRDLLLGSVSLRVAAHAACPVVVVRGEPRPAGDVVVGVDGSALSGPATGFAFEAAALRGVQVRAAHCWFFPVDRWPGPVRPLDPEMAEIEEGHRRQLAEAVAMSRKEFPDVAYTGDLVADDPVPALVRASSEAGLLVVGSRGRGGFAGLMLGSVSHGVLHHAECPVAVVRPER